MLGRQNPLFGVADQQSFQRLPQVVPFLFGGVRSNKLGGDTSIEQDRSAEIEEMDVVDGPPDIGGNIAAAEIGNVHLAGQPAIPFLEILHDGFDRYDGEILEGEMHTQDIGFQEADFGHLRLYD